MGVVVFTAWSFYCGYQGSQSGHVKGFKEGFETSAKMGNEFRSYVWNYLIKRSDDNKKIAESFVKSKTLKDMTDPWNTQYHDNLLFESKIVYSVWGDMLKENDRLSNNLNNWREYYPK